ncbi:MAG: zeta toxin family protein [Tepidisphaerales bacterium]
MAKNSPSVVILAGPNGAGKTTAAPLLLKGTLGVKEFVNADLIAQGLSGFAPERAAMAAGRAMLARIRELARQRASFAFETTLASRSFAAWIESLIDQRGYQFHLVFLWLPTADFAVARVCDRVRLGGHDVPEETIRRRYDRGLWNFFSLYQPLATTWRMYDNSRWLKPKLIVSGRNSISEIVYDRQLWRRVKRGIGYEG